MAPAASRRGAVDLGIPLMILAFLIMGGFMWWLYGQSEAERAADQAVLEEQMAAAADTVDTSGATIVAMGDIHLNAAPYEDSLVRLDGVEIASVLGSQGFWLDTPSNPFLVSLSDELLAQGMTFTTGAPVRVIGTIRAMTPDIAQAWLDAGSINDGDKLAAEFATHFLEAQSVIGEGVSDGNDGGSDGMDDGGNQ